MNRKKFLLPILVLFLSLIFTGNTWSEESTPQYRHPIMRPDRETLIQWMNDYWAAPEMKINEDANLRLSSQTITSFSLLNYLDHKPEEWSQGSCGNCWVWAGTGVMEIALAVQTNALDRISVEFFDACVNRAACDGGNATMFADGYQKKGYAIPWSNSGASYQDGDIGSVAVTCNSIVNTPRYHISSIQEKKIATSNVTRATAISNIKSVLNQNKAIYYSFYLPNQSAWDDFDSFWYSETEDSLWYPDAYCGQTYGSGGGGHAVVILGYNDSDPDSSKHYWLAMNSWGTTTERTNGFFRIPQEINYNCQYPYSSSYLLANTFQIMDVTYAGGICKDARILNVPSEYSTIQSAINAATCIGDTVLVSPKTYYENIQFSTADNGNKVVTLKSHGYGAIIAGKGSDPTVTFNSGETRTAVLDGFIIRSGIGGGIKVSNSSSPSILNNIIYSNDDGIVCDNSSPIIINNTIADNRGMGIYASNNSHVYVFNTIVWNNKNSDIYTASASVTAAYSDIKCSYTGDHTYSFDPLFVGGGDYHLQGRSPCIDMGIGSSYDTVAPEYDIDNYYRPIPWGGKYDIGADEARTVIKDVPIESVNGSISLPFSGMTITFSNISTSVTVICSVSGKGIKDPLTPNKTRDGGKPFQYFYLSTSPSDVFSSAEICLPLPTNPTADWHLYLFYGGSWHDINASKDTDKICGTTTSLSPFVMAVPLPASSSSTAGGNSGGGGGSSASTKCFIATAAYGTPFAREVQVLRNFRDAYLLTNDMGQGFVSFYYKYSPPIANSIRDNSFLRAVVRTILRPVVWLVQNLCPQCDPDQQDASAQQSQAEK